MATFSAQVVDLVGAFSDETALDSFVTEGANEVINAMPRSMLERVAEETAVTDGTTPSEGHKVLHMLRNDGTIDQPCRAIPARKRGRVQDASDMEYATTSDPAYWVQDGKFNIFPNGNGLLVSVPTYSQVASGGNRIDASTAESITNFPNEAEYLVTLYAAIKALQQNMTAKHGNTDIATALTAVNTEIDETLAIADSASTEIGLANAELDKATAEVTLANAEVDKMAAEVGLSNAELDEALVLIDAGIDTATAAINTAVDRVNAAVTLSNTQFDSAVTANTAEDIELAASHVNAGNGFLGEAQGSLNEAQGYVGEVSARVNQVNGQISVAQGFLGTASGYGGIAQGFLGVASGYVNTAQGFIATANAYLSQIQSKLGIAQGYSSEVQTRLAVDTTEYSWYEKQQAKLQADYDKGIQIMRGG